MTQTKKPETVGELVRMTFGREATLSTLAASCPDCDASPMEPIRLENGRAVMRCQICLACAFYDGPLRIDVDQSTAVEFDSVKRFWDYTAAIWKLVVGEDLTGSEFLAARMTMQNVRVELLGLLGRTEDHRDKVVLAGIHRAFTMIGDAVGYDWRQPTASLNALVRAVIERKAAG